MEYFSIVEKFTSEVLVALSIDVHRGNQVLQTAARVADFTVSVTRENLTNLYIAPYEAIEGSARLSEACSQLGKASNNSRVRLLGYLLHTEPKEVETAVVCVIVILY